MGSHVEFLQGGSAVSGAGTIYQQDAHDIHVKHYKGHTTVIYKHENAGTKAADYKAGNTYIGSAAEGSHITVVTDRSNINTDNEDQVYEVLNATGGKTDITMLPDEKKIDRTATNNEA